MDKIIALFEAPASAERTRTAMNREGFATDRLDVVSLADTGRVVEHSDSSPESDLIAHFSVLLDNDDDLPVVEGIVSAIQHGKAALVVHPRGKVEIDQARKILAAHEPESVLWRVAPADSQGGLLGEHAAGFEP